MAQRAKEVDNRIFRVVWRHAPPTPGPSGFVAQITTRKLKSPIGFVFSTPQHTAVLRPNKQLGSFLQTPPDGFIAQTLGSSKSGFAKNAFSSPFAPTWLLSRLNSAPCAAALIPRTGFVAQTPVPSKSGFAENAFSSPFALTRCRAGILASEAASSRLSPRLAL
jgi:hypothetical protein